MLGNFGVFSFLRSWKLTCFRTTFRSAILFQILTFSAFLNISKTAQQNSLSTSSHNLHDIYINVWNFHLDWLTVTPWNFKTNLAYQPAKNPCYKHSPFSCYANFSKLMPTINTCMSSTFQCEYYHCLTFKICN